jgi:hypothetical protein
MSIWIEPLPPGFYTCQGVLEPPLKVTLPRRINLAKLYDAATYPPGPAVEPGPQPLETDSANR